MDDEPFHRPDTQAGAYTNCQCPRCVEARLADPDRITYGAWDVARAWVEGWCAGVAAGKRRS